MILGLALRCQGIVAGEQLMAQPLVSVIMPVFNGGEYIGETLDSIFGQTYDEIELIAADSDSDDATVEILEEYGRRHPGRVRILHGRRDSGIAERRAWAFEAARGDLIAWLDQDDLWEPTKIEKQVRFLEANPEVPAVCSFFDAFDGRTGDTIEWGAARARVGEDVFRDLVEHGCFIGSLTVIFRKSAVKERGIRWRTKDFSYGDDYSLWLELTLDARFGQIPEVLAYYRRHESNQSEREPEPDLQRDYLLKEFLKEHPEAAGKLGVERFRTLARVNFNAAKMARRRGRWIEAGGCVLAAIRYRLAETVKRWLPARPVSA